MRMIDDNFVIWWADGTYSLIPVPTVVVGIGIILLFVFLCGLISLVIGAAEHNRRLRYANYIAQFPVQQIPTEITAPQPVEHYNEQTVRLLELKKKLDAETELAEAYVRAMRVQAEIGELPEVFEHERAKRRARGE